MTDYIELGKRLVACKHFKWMPGMLCQRRLHTGEWVPVRLMEAAYNATVIDYRFVERNAVPSMNQDAARIMAEGYVTQSGWVLAEDLVPDLSDAATKGCVMQLLREMWGGKIVITWGNGWWSIETEEVTWDNDLLPSFESGLLAAMEAAP